MTHRMVDKCAKYFLVRPCGVEVSKNTFKYIYLGFRIEGCHQRHFLTLRGFFDQLKH